MAPFYGWGSTASRLEPLRGGSLLFTTKFPDIPGYSSTNGTVCLKQSISEAKMKVCNRRV